MSTGSGEVRGRNRYGRRRGSRYQLSKDEESVASYLSEGVVDSTLAPLGGLDKDTPPLRERRYKVAPPPTTPSLGTASLRLEELEPSGPAHQDHDEGSPLQPELPTPPALPPIFQGALTEAHWQWIPADVRYWLGLPLGAGPVRDWVISDVALKASLRHEEAARANNEALATAEAAKARAISSRAASERWSRAPAEERSRVMREWEEGDRARAAEVAAARESREADAAILRAKTFLAKPGDKHRRSGSVPAITAAVAPYSPDVPAVAAVGTPYKAPGPYPAAVAAGTPAQTSGPYSDAQPTPPPPPLQVWDPPLFRAPLLPREPLPRTLGSTPLRRSERSWAPRPPTLWEPLPR